MECAFYPVCDATIPLCDGEIYDTVFAIEAREGESKEFEDTCRLSKSLQTHPPSPPWHYEEIFWKSNKGQPRFS